jgi:hypothetical protein
MKNLSIPEEDLEALVLFEKLNIDDKNCIIKIFSDFEKGQGYGVTVDKITEVTSLGYDDSWLIIGVYFALLRTINVNDYMQEDFIRNVVDNSAVKYNIDIEKKSNIENAIRTLLTINNPNPLLTSLAAYLTAQDSNLMAGFSAFSDLKPIKVHNQISGLALSNILKFRYRDGRQEEAQIFLTIDSNDLDEMIDKLIELRENNQQLKSKYNDDIIDI